MGGLMTMDKDKNKANPLASPGLDTNRTSSLVKIKDEQRLDYIRQMIIELRIVSDGLGDGALVYLLEMAALEADAQLQTRGFKQHVTQ
jgi:hypothetical protein